MRDKTKLTQKWIDTNTSKYNELIKQEKDFLARLIIALGDCWQYDRDKLQREGKRLSFTRKNRE